MPYMCAHIETASVMKFCMHVFFFFQELRALTKRKKAEPAEQAPNSQNDSSDSDSDLSGSDTEVSLLSPSAEK